MPLLSTSTPSPVKGQKVYEAAQAADCPPFTLVAISDLTEPRYGPPGQSTHFQKTADPAPAGGRLFAASDRGDHPGGRERD